MLTNFYRSGLINMYDFAPSIFAHTHHTLSDDDYFRCNWAAPRMIFRETVSINQPYIHFIWFVPSMQFMKEPKSNWIRAICCTAFAKLRISNMSGGYFSGLCRLAFTVTNHTFLHWISANLRPRKSKKKKINKKKLSNVLVALLIFVQPGSKANHNKK